MAAPSKSFTFIPDGDIDPDSPITTGLMTELRDNDQHLESWLGESFVAAVDHDHDGVNSKAVAVASLFGSALFNLSTSGTTAVSTGALSFEPKVVLVVGIADTVTDDSLYVGFATGTGTLARSLAFNSPAGGTLYSTDSDSIGGTASGAPGTAHSVELDVTNFAKAAPGIEFTPSSGAITWTFKVLVFGFTS